MAVISKQSKTIKSTVAQTKSLDKWNNHRRTWMSVMRRCPPLTTDQEIYPNNGVPVLPYLLRSALIVLMTKNRTHLVELRTIVLYDWSLVSIDVSDENTALDLYVYIPTNKFLQVAYQIVQLY